MSAKAELGEYSNNNLVIPTTSAVQYRCMNYDCLTIANAISGAPNDFLESFSAPGYLEIKRRSSNQYSSSSTILEKRT